MKKWTRRKKVHSNMEDMYRFYKENYKNPVDKHTYVQTCYLFNKMISDAIIRDSFEFRLPFKLGKIRIKAERQKIHVKDGKIDTKRMPIDWSATRKLWKDMYPGLSWEEIYEIPDKKLLVHTNEHSNGFINRWYWDKTLAHTKNNTAYVFRPVKGGIMDEEYYCGKRGLAAWIKSDDRINEYFE